MNVLEILQEASIFTRAGAYTYGHMVRISTGSAQGKALLDKIQEKIADFDPDEKLEWVAKGPKASIIVAGKGSSVLWFKRPNEEIFGLQGTPGGIEKGLVHADRINRGDIAEAILGASLTAKLIKRGKDRIGKITESDVKSVLTRAISNSEEEITYTVEDKDSQIADKIVFTLRLPSGSMIAIKNPKNWGKFEDLFASGIAYCNDADAEKYSNHFYKNGKVDEVEITSDGVSNQKGRKTDVQAIVRDPATGKTRDLRNVDISLKADSNIYGQHGTGGLQAGKAVWLSKAQALFGQLGVNITMPARHVDITDFWRQVYKQATKQLNQHFAHYTATQETNFIERLADVIDNQGSSGNRNLRLVSFEKGSYSLHSFKILKQRLINAKIDFGAELTIGPRSGKPSIVIYDRTSGDTLTAIRYFQGGEKSSNYFEKGPLLHELTRIVKKANQTQSADTQPTQEPTTTAKEPQSVPQQDTKSFQPSRRLVSKQPTKGAEPSYEPSLSIHGYNNAPLDPSKDIEAAENR